MINNEDKKYYGTDYSTQAIIMEEQIYSYITPDFDSFKKVKSPYTL